MILQSDFCVVDTCPLGKYDKTGVCTGKCFFIYHIEKLSLNKYATTTLDKHLQVVVFGVITVVNTTV